MAQSLEELARRWFDQVWNRTRREAIAELMAPGAVLHEAGNDSIGPEGFYPFFDRMQATFSEMRLSVEDTITQGDKISVRWLCTARHSGDGLDMSPKGTTIQVTGITIIRFADGMIVEAWQNWDMLGMLQQITGEAKPATYVATS